MGLKNVILGFESLYTVELLQRLSVPEIASNMLLDAREWMNEWHMKRFWANVLEATCKVKNRSKHVLSLEKLSRSNFRHWKSFFHGLPYFFIHTLGSKSIHLPFIHSQASKSSVEATSSTESRFFMACSTFIYLRLAQNRFIYHSFILKPRKAYQKL